MLKGRALLALEHVAEARQALDEARAGAERLGLRWILMRILLVLSEIADRSEQSAEAKGLRHEAQSHFAFITDHCPPALRESILNLPEVAKIARHT